MGQVMATMKVLPDSPERDLQELGTKVEEVLIKHGKLYKRSIQPIAFGLNALVFSFALVEEKTEGGTEPIEKEVMEIEGVNSAEVTDVTKIADLDFK